MRAWTFFLDSIERATPRRVYHRRPWLSDTSQLGGAPCWLLARPGCGTRRCRRTDARNGDVGSCPDGELNWAGTPAQLWGQQATWDEGVSEGGAPQKIDEMAASPPAIRAHSPLAPRRALYVRLNRDPISGRRRFDDSQPGGIAASVGRLTSSVGRLTSRSSADGF